MIIKRDRQLIGVTQSILMVSLIMILPAISFGNVLKDSDYGNIPICFIPNHGQVDDQVSYYIQGTDKTVYFTQEGLNFTLTEAVDVSEEGEERFKNEPGGEGVTESACQNRWVIKLDFIGARPGVQPESLDKSETEISYFKGRPENWSVGLQTSSKIIYRNLWPGIDLVYYGTTNSLKYDFIVHPGADPDQIRLAYRGVDCLETGGQGRLAIVTPIGVIHDDFPIAWQDVEGGGKEYIRCI